ncbi:MAG TPA: RNA polymerase subunit sigma, partial [Spirochaetota bacterium]|nr:RNA polymerase subunit sigma [Spirochaetota bacterium]
LYNSQRYAEEADVVLVVGTSAVVYPAASIPGVVKSHGGIVIEFNLERTELTGSITDIFIQGKAGQTLPQVVNLLKE